MWLTFHLMNHRELLCQNGELGYPLSKDHPGTKACEDDVIIIAVPSVEGRLDRLENLYALAESCQLPEIVAAGKSEVLRQDPHDLDRRSSKYDVVPEDMRVRNGSGCARA